MRKKSRRFGNGIVEESLMYCYALDVIAVARSLMFCTTRTSMHCMPLQVSAAMLGDFYLNWKTNFVRR